VQSVASELPFLGQDVALKVLSENLSQLELPNGRSRMVLVRGRPGFGKTRLLKELRKQLHETDRRFVSGVFSRQENSLPFHALANAFNEYLLSVRKYDSVESERLRARFSETLGSQGWLLAELLPGIIPFLDENSGNYNVVSEGDEDENSHLVKAFADFMRGIATDGQGLVVIFENIQWADEKSMALLDNFFSNSNSSNQKILMVLSFRASDEAENKVVFDFLHKYQRLKRRYSEIKLDPLGETEVARLVRAILPGKIDGEAQLTQYCFNTSRGNPLFVIELIKSLVASDGVLAIPSTDSVNWKFQSNHSRPLSPVESIDLLLDQLESFDPDEREYIQVAAVCGMTFQFELLTGDNQSQKTMAARAIQKAVSLGLLMKVSDSQEFLALGKSFAFCHPSIKETIYNRIPRMRRIELHRRIALKMFETMPHPTEKHVFYLAHHFQNSLAHEQDDQRLVDLAFRFGIEAGEFALNNGSWQSAETYFETSLNLFANCSSSIGLPCTKARLLLRLSQIFDHQKKTKRALYYLRESMQVPLNPEQMVEMAAATLHFQLVHGAIGESIKLADDTIKKFSILDDVPKFFSRVLFWIGIWRDSLLLK